MMPDGEAIPRGRPRQHRQERRGLKSTDTGMRLLSLLAAAEGPLSLTELAAGAGVGASTAHRHLAGFVDAGLVKHERSGGDYDLGPLALKIGLAALSRLDIVAIAEPRLLSLAVRTKSTALLSVWADRGPTIVRWQRAPMPFVTSLGLGSTLPATRSATGLVFLSFLPTSVTAGAVAREGEHLVDAESIGRCRASRLAWVDGTVIPGLSAIASPILDLQGEAAAAITLTSPDPALTLEEHGARSFLRETTAELSAALGHRAKGW